MSTFCMSPITMARMLPGKVSVKGNSLAAQGPATLVAGPLRQWPTVLGGLPQSSHPHLGHAAHRPHKQPSRIVIGPSHLGHVQYFLMLAISILLCHVSPETTVLTLLPLQGRLQAQRVWYLVNVPVRVTIQVVHSRSSCRAAPDILSAA